MQQEFLILGSPQSKANSRMITRSGLSIKSPSARLYEKLCIDQLLEQKTVTEPLMKPVGVKINIIYRSRRNDLDESIILDCLQKAGVIQNDRQVYHKEVDKVYEETTNGINQITDNDNPRAEIMVWEL